MCHSLRIDLSEYIQPPNNDSPLVRFLKNDDRLGEMSSLPWVARTHKLWRIGRLVRNLLEAAWVVPSWLRSVEPNGLFVWIYTRSRLCILLGTVGPPMKLDFFLPLQLVKSFVPENILLKLVLWTYAKPAEEGAWPLLDSFHCFLNQYFFLLIRPFADFQLNPVNFFVSLNKLSAWQSSYASLLPWVTWQWL